jgi:ABC-type amino acid transport substrate-binding protein
MLLGISVAQAQANPLAQLKATGLLRVCADPDNLPFSSRDPREPGYDVELAGEIATQLGAHAEVTWVSTFSGQSALRQLLEGKCDLFMGLPRDERFLKDNSRLALSMPYYTLRHALVSPKARPVKELRGLQELQVAVEAMSMGDIFLFQNLQPRLPYRTQPEAFQAVARGEAPVALLWAPIGWWLAQKHPEAQMQGAELSAPNLEFKIAAGMRKGDGAFQTVVNTAITHLVAQGKVADILSRYGQPTTVVAQATADTHQGQSLYYQICALCHGQSAEGGGPVPNLKEFQGTAERFIKITLDGRPDKGMPPWQGKLSEDEVRAIFAFIQTLPK